MQDEDYKGIYFDTSKEQQFYEGGAHFKYKALVKALSKLLLSLPIQRRGTSADPKRNCAALNLLIGLNEKKRHRGISRNNRGADLFTKKSYSKTKTLSEFSKSQPKTIRDSNKKSLKTPDIEKDKTHTIKSRNNRNCCYHNNSKNNYSLKLNTKTDKKNYSVCKNFQNFGSVYLIMHQNSAMKKEAQSLMALKEKHSNILNKTKKLKLHNISKKQMIKNSAKTKKNSNIKKTGNNKINNIFDQGQKITNVNNTCSIVKYSNQQISSIKKFKFQKYNKLKILEKMISPNSINNKNFRVNDNYKICTTKNANTNNDSNFLTEVSSYQINSIKKTQDSKSNKNINIKNKDIFNSKRIIRNNPHNILFLQKISNNTKNSNKSKDSSCISNNNTNLNNNKKLLNKNKNFKKNQKSRNEFKNTNKNNYTFITQKNTNLKELSHEKTNHKNIPTYNNNHLLNIPKRKILYNIIQKNNQPNVSIDIIKNTICNINSSSNLERTSKKYTSTNNINSNDNISIKSVLNKTNKTSKNQEAINNTNTTNSKILRNINGNFNNTSNNFIEISLLSDSCNNISTKTNNKIKIDNNKINKDNSNGHRNINQQIKQKKSFHKENININENISNYNISNGNIILKSKINISVINNLNNFTNIGNINNININNANNISISNSNENNNEKSRNHPIKMVKMNTNNIRNEFFDHFYKTNEKLSKKNTNNYNNMSGLKTINHIKTTIKKNNMKSNYNKENRYKGNNSKIRKNVTSKNNYHFYCDKNLVLLTQDNSISKMVFQEKGIRNKKKKIEIEKNICIYNNKKTVKSNNDKKNNNLKKKESVNVTHFPSNAKFFSKINI